MKDHPEKVIGVVDLDQQEFNMTSEELFKIHKSLCATALSLMTKKNHDYAGKKGLEPFANFTRAEAMGITTTEKAILVRMLDKISRLSSFAEAGEFKVEDEKLEDTILDVINYSVLLYAFVQDKQRQKEMPLELVHLYKKYDHENDVYDLYSKGGLVPNTPDTV